MPTSSANPVKWTTHHMGRVCSECGNGIAAGERMALYDEVGVDSRRANFRVARQPHFHIQRRYCEACGQLLQDSFTTTEVL